MNIRTTSTAAIALILAGSMANAESHVNADTNAEQAADSMGNAADSAGNAVENGAEATGDALENAGDAAANAADNATDAAGNAVDNAANATENAADNAAAATAGAVNDMGDMQNFDMTTSENLIRTRDITGGEIYRMDAPEDNAEWDSNMPYQAAGEGWERIGSIEDVVLSKSGQMVGIVGEVGGFLGLGDKMVMMPVQDIRLTAIDDGSYAYVTQMTQEDIEAAQDVDEGFWE